jgi:hypothetical protein
VALGVRSRRGGNVHLGWTTTEGVPEKVFAVARGERFRLSEAKRSPSIRVAVSAEKQRVTCVLTIQTMR